MLIKSIIKTYIIKYCHIIIFIYSFNIIHYLIYGGDYSGSFKNKKGLRHFYFLNNNSSPEFEGGGVGN